MLVVSSSGGLGAVEWQRARSQPTQRHPGGADGICECADHVESKQTGKNACESDGCGVRETQQQQDADARIVSATIFNSAMGSGQECSVLAVSSRPDTDCRWPTDHGMAMA